MGSPGVRLGQSRLKSEFEVLEDLGRGGFGDVLKVSICLSVCSCVCLSVCLSVFSGPLLSLPQARNYLDGRIYAIKRIKLTSGSRIMEKVTREVELLSQMNHEHIVRYTLTITLTITIILTTITYITHSRYYNAWIEMSSEDETHRHADSDSNDDEEEETCDSSFDSEDDEEEEEESDDDEEESVRGEGDLSTPGEEDDEVMFTSEFSADLSSEQLQQLGQHHLEAKLLDMSLRRLRR